MNPIYFHDYPKFVYQTPDVREVHYQEIPKKTFKVDATKKSDKSKKDLKKKKPEEDEL